MDQPQATKWIKILLVSGLILIILFLINKLFFAGTFKVGVSKADFPVYATHNATHNDQAGIWTIDDDNGLLIFVNNGKDPFYDDAVISYQKKGNNQINPINLPTQKGIDLNEVYTYYPYIFILLDNDQVFIYNTENKKQRTIDVKTCKGANVTSISYQENTISWAQFKEWSECSGSFQKRLKLDF